PRVAGLLGTVAALLLVVAGMSLWAAIRISQEKQVAETNAELERLAREDADRNAEIARENAAIAVKAQAEASAQAQVALGTVYQVVTKADEKLRTKADMGPLRKELLEIAMAKLDKISTDAATSGKADRTMGVALQRMAQFYEQMGHTEKQIDALQRSLLIFN